MVPNRINLTLSGWDCLNKATRFFRQKTCSPPAGSLNGMIRTIWKNHATSDCHLERQDEMRPPQSHPNSEFICRRRNIVQDRKELFHPNCHPDNSCLKNNTIAAGKKMSVPPISPDLVKALEPIQRDEATEYHVYRYLQSREKNPYNADVLEKMALEEQGHYQVCRRYTGKELPPCRFRMWFYIAVSRLLGLTFGLKLMEKREGGAVEAYQALVGKIPEAEDLLREEQQHELEIISLLDEKGLKYVGSVVLGLNDALVEFTGSLAGFTFALQDTRVIAMAGVILGVAASLSMGASEYLSRKSESSEKNPFTAAFYTGIAYVITVIVMVLPYLLLENPYIALGLTLTIAVAIIVVFTFYVSIAQDLPFWRRFLEMAAISLGIAAISFLIGIAVKTVLNVNI